MCGRVVQSSAPLRYALVDGMNALRAIDDARRLDQDLLARRMTDLGGLRAHARRYRELKSREPSWEVPEPNVAE
jgi:hypothetical protein